uniref:C1q domain-containing protein n=1 Tax=Dicentrarchus labrax TaxID=13489 RepID=A0A8P4GPF0_DICLA
MTGFRGDEGEKGDRGPQGVFGPKGDRGFKGELQTSPSYQGQGDKGEQGLEGPPGDQGLKGDDGFCPDACESSQGPPGPSGLPGPVGSRGLPGIPGLLGPKGEKGDTGDLGQPGVPGSAGQKGEPGPQGDCNCTDGGDMGLMGMMGLPGPCMSNIQSAFAAGLESSYPPPQAPVVFSQVLYNIQGSYDPSTGIYTAPVNGTYILSYHITVHERVLKVGLFHNFRPVIKTTETKLLGTTSHSVVLHLARGHRVWIQVKDQVTNGMFAGIEDSVWVHRCVFGSDQSCLLFSRRRLL